MSYRVREYKDVQLEYESSATLTVKAYTDIGAQPAATLSFPAAATGRKVETRPLDGIAGNWIYFEITTTGTLKLYAGLFRERPIGVYLDGANSEKWVSPPLAFD